MEGSWMKKWILPEKIPEGYHNEGNLLEHREIMGLECSKEGYVLIFCVRNQPWNLLENEPEPFDLWEILFFYRDLYWKGIG